MGLPHGHTFLKVRDLSKTVFSFSSYTLYASFFALLLLFCFIHQRPKATLVCVCITWQLSVPSLIPSEPFNSTARIEAVDPTKSRPKYHLVPASALYPLLFYHQNGGVFWSKGNLSIVGGTFTENEGPENGGVVFCSDKSRITVAGGIFENNKAQDGAVALVDKGSKLQVENGVFTGNTAESEGGAFSVNEEAGFQVGGGLLDVRAKELSVLGYSGWCCVVLSLKISRVIFYSRSDGRCCPALVSKLFDRFDRPQSRISHENDGRRMFQPVLKNCSESARLTTVTWTARPLVRPRASIIVWPCSTSGYTSKHDMRTVFPTVWTMPIEPEDLSPRSTQQQKFLTLYRRRDETSSVRPAFTVSAPLVKYCLGDNNTNSCFLSD